MLVLVSGLMRRKQIICRIEGTYRYLPTPTGRAAADMLTKAYGCVLSPGLPALDSRLPPGLAERSPLAPQWKNLNSALDGFIDHGLAAA